MLHLLCTLQAALARAPDDPSLLGALGLAQVSQGDLDDGIASYEKAGLCSPCLFSLPFK